MMDGIDGRLVGGLVVLAAVADARSFGKAAQRLGMTQSGVIMGSPSYMSPEQAAGRNSDIGPASDVYSLGAMLYELLTGRPPFRAPTPVATMREVLETEPTAPRRLKADIPLDLETICLKCLEKSPSARYATARMLAEVRGVAPEDVADLTTANFRRLFKKTA